MRQIPYRFVACGLAVLAVLALSACEPKTPEEQVAAARAQYSVKLESFTVEEPQPEPPAVEEALILEGDIIMAAAAAVAEEAGEGMEEAEEVLEEAVETGPRQVDVILHMLLGFNGDEALPGITVEVTQADPFGKEKEPTLHWIETAGMTKSDVKQVDLRLEGVEYEDGDAFSVLLREVVPAADRSRYREFAEAGSS